ncbi:outer membrane lipoprotein-sorting protein [Shewanella gelidii]|uniref:Outer membrane lipoprotein-sorting protein n=1 Tax=Shewanella gelidii TaxID=1642821 RepID=A0A917JNH9_9GAMM|nr:outer membrane lipoprotein-sorting protein [Shewanella gelidii]MCL1097893.1 outer membrane lipoprotein-sorting protein [Shewanella gelidii]GGI77913.1 outer membrane lipoprotein-sorting protein [Shewanella gelidii]
MQHPMLALLASLLLFTTTGLQSAELTAKQIVHQSMEQWRGVSSESTMSMIIHRPDWQRTMTMRAWTQGDKLSLVRVTAPKKDVGNATLIKDNSMWSFAPKINRVIKIPSSMMSQGWMGSDFSNKDIGKSTDIVDQYQHRLIETLREGEHQVYVIESIPLEDAAVVWGKEVLQVRDDFVVKRHEFWDQDGELIKVMVASEIRPMGGRAVASRLRMAKVATPDQWTEMVTHQVAFDVALSPQIFTLSNLRNPRR